jgi:hypothetical protein
MDGTVFGKRGWYETSRYNNLLDPATSISATEYLCVEISILSNEVTHCRQQADRNVAGGYLYYNPTLLSIPFPPS